MKLYLVRHGNAIGGANDIARPLSSEGVSEVKRVADFLMTHDYPVDVIYHSIRLRARQTAEILHDRLKVRKALIERSDLSPNDEIDEIADLLINRKRMR